MPLEKNPPILNDPQGKEHCLTATLTTFGRAVDCDVVIASKSVSRMHARISCEGHRWLVEDLGSTNGTYLNDERLIDKVEMRDGDTLKIGEVTFTFHDPDSTVRENPIPELDIDQAAGIVRVNRRAVTLSTKEYKLLAYLFDRRGQVCSKDDIGREVWSEYESGGVFDYQIENLVRRLRTRIETDPASPQLLLTVRGMGYKLLPS